MDRLFAKGYISNPAGPRKSVILPSEGLKRAKDLYDKLFVKSPDSPA